MFFCIILFIVFFACLLFWICVLWGFVCLNLLYIVHLLVVFKCALFRIFSSIFKFLLLALHCFVKIIFGLFHYLNFYLYVLLCLHFDFQVYNIADSSVVIDLQL